MEKGKINSDEARRDWRELLDWVQHRGEHITVMRYGQTAAVMVPAEWYEQAKVLISKEMPA